MAGSIVGPPPQREYNFLEAEQACKNRSNARLIKNIPFNIGTLYDRNWWDLKKSMKGAFGDTVFVWSRTCTNYPLDCGVLQMNLTAGTSYFHHHWRAWNRKNFYVPFCEIGESSSNCSTCLDLRVLFVAILFSFHSVRELGVAPTVIM